MVQCQMIFVTGRCRNDAVQRTFTNTGSLMTCPACTMVVKVQQKAERMEFESPKPGVGGFIAEELFLIVGRGVGYTTN